VQVFHFKVVLANREHHMFPDEVVTRIFSNIKSIYQFHHDFLLPQLERRMTEQSVSNSLQHFCVSQLYNLKWHYCIISHGTVLMTIFHLFCLTLFLEMFKYQ